MKRIFIFCLAFMLIPAIALCSIKVLDRDTDLRPQGWAAGALKFKQGTTVELNERGEVISGVIKDVKLLRPTGYGFHSNKPFDVYSTTLPANSFVFNGDSIVTFDENGNVISGVIGTDTRIYLTRYKEPLVLFKADNIISFDKNGNLIKGTLGDDTFLCPVGSLSGGELVKFKSNTEVVFGPNAQVIKGTITNNLTIQGTTYPAGTTLQFNETATPKIVE